MTAHAYYRGSRWAESLPAIDWGVTVRLDGEDITHHLYANTALDPMDDVRRRVADEYGVEISTVYPVTVFRLCAGCGLQARGNAHVRELCDECAVEHLADLEEWLDGLEADPRFANEKRCGSCMTSFASKDGVSTCDRCIREYRAIDGWCNRCRVPKWTHQHCEGCK